MKVTKKYNANNMMVIAIIGLFLFLFYLHAINDEVSIFYPVLQTNNETLKTDFYSSIIFSSNGAFIPGQKVNVEIDILDNKYSASDIDGFIVYFHDSYSSASQPYIDDSALGTVQQTELIHVKLIDDQHAKGSGGLYYNRPGDHGLTIFTSKNGDILNTIYHTNNAISVAPLETRLQIRNNNIMLGLSVIGLFLASLQILAIKDPLQEKRAK
jgi:hypothetical protein